MICSLDIGLNHGVICVKQNDQYLFYLYTIQSSSFVNKINELFNIFESIDFSQVQKVIIEQQMSNTVNIQIQYAVGMYFKNKKIDFCLQRGDIKYSIFKGQDKRNNKIKSELYFQDLILKNKDLVQIKLNQWQNSNYKHHNYYVQTSVDFMKNNNIDKLDDFGDCVLMIQEYEKSNSQKK